ncbi:hypothetical protein [Rhodococcus sp. 852002-51564_SCH6189132-a]|uniref:hypothetical protein n=1 Tax=Rhodococcus sp. 852002-51564_SCH6189132-a TaxID=1834103 RepID=UPI000A6BFE33|nr:hypothetical protein [Rhodococcus sp. 852002-51564_SCH6189132-a]
MPVMKRMLVIAALLLIPAALAWGSQALTRPAGSPEIGDASVTVSVVPAPVPDPGWSDVARQPLPTPQVEWDDDWDDDGDDSGDDSGDDDWDDDDD